MDLTGAVQDQTHAPNFMDPASGRVIAALSFLSYADQSDVQMFLDV